MKKGIMALVGAAGLLGLIASSASAANPSCSADDLYCVDTGSATAGSGNPLTVLTANGFQIFQGVLEIGPKNQGSTPGLYVVFDGFDGNVNPLDGYLGYNSADIAKSNSVLGLIGASSGNFERDGSNDQPISNLLAASPDLTATSFNPIIGQLQGLAPNLTFLQTGQVPPLPDLMQVGHAFLPSVVK